MITISVSIRQHEPILHGRQLGDYSRNQVASSKILGAMATKMVATLRVAHEAEHSPEYTAFYTGALLTGIICEYRDFML